MQITNAYTRYDKQLIVNVSLKMYNVLRRFGCAVTCDHEHD